MKDRRTFICLRCWIPYIATSGMDWSYFCHNYSCCESCLQLKDTPQHQQLCTDNNRVLWPTTTFNHLILLHFQCCCHTTHQLIEIFFEKLHNILLPWCGLRILRPSPQQTTSNGLIPHPVVEVPHTLIIHSIAATLRRTVKRNAEDKTTTPRSVEATAEAVSEAMMIYISKVSYLYYYHCILCLYLK